MNRIPAIAIFDIGKTNKKIFLFNEHYQIVFEQSVRFDEIFDEDGDACDDLSKLTKWVYETIAVIFSLTQFEIKAINFSAYGASFVHIGEDGKPVAPLYNYLKPFPLALKEKFYQIYGDEVSWSLTTASPVLDNLNSGMQLYYLKNKKGNIYEQIHSSLHLPQYISYLLTGKTYSDITSIGCHTGLWNFEKNDYHDWVKGENIQSKLAPIFPSDEVVEVTLHHTKLKVGIGLHDSSSALIPYLSNFSEHFILLSTGTWCISLNPFNHQPLTASELENDCLTYITYKGKPVKASRLFAGNEHEDQLQKLATHFSVPIHYYEQIVFDDSLIHSVFTENAYTRIGIHPSDFMDRDFDNFSSYELAYHQLIYDIIVQQKMAIQLILNNTDVTCIFVDGGFAKNTIFMHFLATAFPTLKIYAATVSQASAIGAALAIHDHWNSFPLGGDWLEVKKYL